MHTRVLINKGDTNPTFASDDRIFLGEGLFETLKVVNANPCYPLLHWQRLQKSAQELGIVFDISFDDWLEHLVHQIKVDNLYHGGIKVILSGGSAPRGLAEHGQASQMLLQTFNYQVNNAPLQLIRASWLRDASNPIYHLKSINYLEAITARRQALALGKDDALFYNLNHNATETTCANLFLISNDSIITPALSEGVLPGIARSRIIAHCNQHDLACIETSVTEDMIIQADALFTSNSLQGIRPVQSLDSTLFNVNHPLLEQLIIAI